MLGRTTPFKEGGLGGGEDGTGSLQTSQGDLMVERMAGGDGIDGDEDGQPAGEQVEGGLLNANVGLEAAEQDRLDVGREGAPSRRPDCGIDARRATARGGRASR